MNSRDKGKRGELEWAGFLRDHGFGARRGQQHKGTPDSPDVTSSELDGYFHCEVKRVERLNVQDAYDKAARERGNNDRIAYVAHRRNHCDWLVTVSGEDFMRLVREYTESGKRKSSRPRRQGSCSS